MDPVLNPYAPGAGTPPPELSGREELREKVRVALERVRRGRPAKSVLMVGLRGGRPSRRSTCVPWLSSLGPTRNNLISKGMVWSPSHGDTAFTVPLFDEFMVRIMPADDWRD